MIAATGWTWEYLDEFLTLPRLDALTKHWERYPPVHITAALFTGVAAAATGAAPESAASRSAAPVTNETVVREMHTDPRTLKWQSKSND